MEDYIPLRKYLDRQELLINRIKDDICNIFVEVTKTGKTIDDFNVRHYDYLDDRCERQEGDEIYSFNDDATERIRLMTIPRR